ncbi:MAG: hypothetical protein NUV51_06665 [Sulfuricaulis sp.]|nr:hypothetical protein [Sulfuricaulis sp.]
MLPQLSRVAEPPALTWAIPTPADAVDPEVAARKFTLATEGTDTASDARKNAAMKLATNIPLRLRPGRRKVSLLAVYALIEYLTEVMKNLDSWTKLTRRHRAAWLMDVPLF